MKANMPFFSTHAKSSAMFISIMIHGILIAIAVTLVVATAIPKTEAPFVPKKVLRPKMPPKPIKVPVDTKKRKPKPRLRQRILTERKTLVDIRMPDTSGVTGGLGNMGGTGNWNLGFDIKMDLFGSNKPMGNELIGTFYDLKLTADGKPTQISKLEPYAANTPYFEEISSFARSWKAYTLRNYFRAPVQKYATSFMIHLMNANEAPKAFGVEQAVKPRHWVAHYVGNIAAPETGEFRFWGRADDVLLVRVKGKLVLDGSHHNHIKKMTNWENRDPMNRKFPIDGESMAVGDWFSLKKGDPVEIQVLFGEAPGEIFFCQLLIEQRGVEYRKFGEQPILPVFKTAEIPKELRNQIRLPPWATLEGPTFGVVNE